MQTKSRPIELLSPAKDLNCGIEAINHGADAVYIGAPKFGARSAAGNSLDDIRELCEYAHLYGARIYVTLNTILKEDELEEAERMIWDLWRVGTDALIIQDMGITRLNLLFRFTPARRRTTALRKRSVSSKPQALHRWFWHVNCR